MKNRDTPILENNVNSIAAYEPGGGAIAPQLWKVWGGGEGKTIPPHLFFGKNLRKTEFLSLKQKQKNIVQFYALKPNDLFFYFKVL